MKELKTDLSPPFPCTPSNPRAASGFNLSLEAKISGPGQFTVKYHYLLISSSKDLLFEL